MIIHSVHLPEEGRLIVCVNNFVCGCAGSSLLGRLFSHCGQRGLLSSHSALASRCSDFSFYRAQALEHEGFGSCDAWAELPQGVWDLPDQGLEPCLLHRQADSSPLSHQGSLSLKRGKDIGLLNGWDFV